MKQVVLMLALLVAGCGAAPESVALPRQKLTLKGADGEIEILVEVAADNASRQQGLMGREKLCDLCGMVFVWEEPEPVAMWMKGTPLPLDMAFIRDGRIVGVTQGVPYDETTLPAPMPVQMVLEVGAGKLAAWGMGVGSTVETVKR